jgi:hypothetical protein
LPTDLLGLLEPVDGHRDVAQHPQQRDEHRRLTPAVPPDLAARELEVVALIAVGQHDPRAAGGVLVHLRAEAPSLQPHQQVGEVADRVCGGDRVVDPR